MADAKGSFRAAVLGSLHTFASVKPYFQTYLRTQVELFFKSLKVLLHARLTPDRRRLVKDFRASTSRV